MCDKDTKVKLQLTIEVKNNEIAVTDPTGKIKTSESKEPKKKLKLND